MKQKKAQITLFIILGFIILLAVSVTFLYINSKTSEKTSEELIEDVPLWAAPMQSYVKGCIKEEAKKALKKIGEHGGYIDMNGNYLSEKKFNINLFNPTESDGAVLSLGTNSPVAYWWYMTGENTCTDCYVSSNAVTVPEIEEQLDKYLMEKIAECTEGFKPFKEQGFEVYEGNITVSSKVNIEDVSISIDYPISLIKGESKTNINSFEEKINLNLLRILNLANSITYIQSEHEFLEYFTLYLMSAYQGIDENKLPPIAAVDNAFDTVVWFKPLVEENLKEIFATYAPFIQVAGTDGAKRLEGSNQIESAFYDLIFLNISNITGVYNVEYPSAEVNFYYFNWPLYFDITPRNGNMLEPKTEKYDYPFGLAPSSQTNIYQFFYDISYPVIVEVRESNALDGEDYSFMFALEVNIRNNKNLYDWFIGRGTLPPRDPDTVIMSVIGGTKNIVNCTEESSGWRCPLTNKLYGGGIKGSLACNKNCIETTAVFENRTPSLMCNRNQRLSGNITVNPYNLKDNKPLDGVVVSYGCGDLGACSQGTTKIVNSTTSSFKGKLPLCYGGYLLLQKKGFRDKAVKLDTEYGVSGEIDVYMEQYEEFNVGIKKYQMLSSDNMPYSYTGLNTNEKVIININKIKENALEQDFKQTLFLDVNNNSFDKLSRIKLVPGLYDVDINLIDMKGFTIPKECIHICVEGFPDNPFEDCDQVNMKIPQDKIEMEMTLLGGVSLKNGTYNASMYYNGSYYYVDKTSLWNVSAPAIYNTYSENVEFYIIKVPTPTCLTERSSDEARCLSNPCIGMEELDRVKQYSLKYRDWLEPRFY